MEQGTKEMVQYASAIAMLLSGIVLAFLCFFLNDYNITDSVMWYVSEALIYAGGIFGVSIYFRSRLGEMESRTNRKIEEEIEKRLQNDKS